MSFAENLDQLTTWLEANVAVLIGGVVAVIVLTAILHHDTPTTPDRDGAFGGCSRGGGRIINLERHLDSRREGAPVGAARAVLRGSPRRRPPRGKRRPGGARRAELPQRRGRGIRPRSLDRRAAHHSGHATSNRARTCRSGRSTRPRRIDFVGVVVRSCRKTGEFYELGCEFEKTPPWNVLLLFGVTRRFSRLSLSPRSAREPMRARKRAFCAAVSSFVYRVAHRLDPADLPLAVVGHHAHQHRPGVADRAADLRVQVGVADDLLSRRRRTPARAPCSPSAPGSSPSSAGTPASAASACSGTPGRRG